MVSRKLVLVSTTNQSPAVTPVSATDTEMSDAIVALWC
jgi:hypothetical protein